MNPNTNMTQALRRVTFIEEGRGRTWIAHVALGELHWRSYTGGHDLDPDPEKILIMYVGTFNGGEQYRVRWASDKKGPNTAWYWMLEISRNPNGQIVVYHLPRGDTPAINMAGNPNQYRWVSRPKKY
jgi:hypothetical protein